MCIGTRQPPHHQAHHGHVNERFTGGTQPLVIHRLMRRLWQSQAKVRSTTHRLGKTRKPLGGMSLCQSIFLPSLAPSSAQILAIFSGTGFGGLRTTSTLKPSTFSAHSLPRPW